MNDSFVDFVNDIEAAELPLSVANSAQDAVVAFIAQELPAIKRALIVKAKNLNTIPYGTFPNLYHGTPADFYKAKVCSIQYKSWLRQIDAARTTECDIERIHCPDIQSCP